MGYGVYDDLTGNRRFSGYGVPAFCDFPGCDEEIDRGMGWRCEEYVEYTFDEDTEEETETEREGCGLQFCTEHSEHSTHGDDVVWDGREHPDWIRHLLTDESWQAWRDENPAEVDRFTAALVSPESETGDDRD